ncbi:membrane protein [Candidatus Enterococcus huntleyi]|uniref:membrane protein n=1 Tax=Candidatus Enterococcus huntleyi TaxID=1857217 RepID=UPI001F2A6856|nr:membrane protein [Enterococcus sp. JM4C]
MIASNLGVDTLSIALFGIMNYLPIQFGYLSLGFNILVLSLAFIFDRSQIGLGSLINGLGVGIGVNIFTSYLASHTLLVSYPLLFCLLGVLLFGLGIGIYVSAQLGAAALECLTLMIVKLSKRSIKVTRILIDCSMVLIGLLLGSKSLGIGTLGCILTTGLLLEVTLALQTRLSLKKTT